MSKIISTLGIVKPNAFANKGAIFQAIASSGLKIKQMQMMQLTKEKAGDFYAIHREKPFFGELVNFMSSGPAIPMEMVGEDAIARWRHLLGPTKVTQAIEERPDSLRARFGDRTDNTKNACHGADSPENAKIEIDFYFPPSGPLPNTARLHNSLLCVVKPHAWQSLGDIVNDIDSAGFNITALKSFVLDSKAAEKWLDIDKTHTSSDLSQVTSGPLLALEIDDQKDPEKFYDFVGPANPEDARREKPRSLRGKYGKSRDLNAIHVSQGPKYSLMELEYFFRTLCGSK